ncbi:MAG: SurA N-terminal domain-containing protein [Muribaculaceae bacterium]|nr:SurA N-terminal domain-containing protein [Muribaculaceae bacterium]
MATLEKIRSKSGLLIVVIGLALLAFIIGDALTNSRNIFGDHTTVAKVGSAKIDITEYQRKREELNQQLEQARRQNPASVANFDVQTLPEMAINSLLQETLLLNAAEKAGINVTGNLLRYYMIENPSNQSVMQLVQQLNQAGLSVQTPQQAYEVIFNPQRNGMTDAQMEPYQRLWLAAETSAKDDIARQVYARILTKSVKANDLDKKALYNDYVNTAQVELAFLPYGTLDAKEYPVSAAELKKLYEETKNEFKVDEDTKDVSFIAVSITPSNKDLVECRKLAERTVATLSSDSAAQLSKDLKKDGVVMTHHALRAADLPAGPMKEFILTGATDSVRLVSSNMQGFTAVRVTGRTSQVDSIQVNVVMAQTVDLGKKVMAELNSGLPADSVTVRFSPDSVMPQLNQWIPLYTAQGATNALPKETLDSLVNAGGKYISINQGAQGMVMASLVKQNAPVTIYEYDEVNYVLGPSTKTVGDERAKLEKFLAANTNADDFAKNAEKAGFSLQRYSLTQSSAAVPRSVGLNSYYPDSRQVVRWVMIDGDPGDVSHIYESKSVTNPMLYAVAVNAKYDDYTPLSNPDVNQYLTEKVRRSKAGDKLMKQYSQKTQSMQSAAQAMGVEVNNIESFRFGQNPGVRDAAVMGKIYGSKADKKVMIVKGDDGIYVYQVNGKKKENFPYNEQEYEQKYIQQVNPNLIQMLMGNSRIKNNVYKFEAGD